MGVEYNKLGEVCDSRKIAKGEKFVWETTTILQIQCLVHEQQLERKKESLEWEYPWRDNSISCWSISKEFWS
jgi:hypothetical protein